MDGPAKGDPLAPRALPEEKQEKEQQVLPKPTRTSCSNSDALILVIRSLPDKMDRWQAAASCALASAFGPTGWKEILPQFWLDEAQDLFSDSSFTAGPFKTVVLKKKAAKISKMPIERVAQTVPPELVGFVRQILLERGVEAEMQALEERKDSNLDSHITLTRALTEYKLNRDDIANLHFESRTNPHSNPYRNAAPMRLYTLRDIIKTALLKHGGPSGLSAVREGVAVRKENLLHKHEEELRAALAEKGLELRPKFYLCEQYINKPSSIALEKVVDTMLEMEFYFKHAKYEEFERDEYETFMTFSWGEPNVDEKETISRDAKKKALFDLVKEMGVDGVLAMPDVPDVVRKYIEAREDEGGFFSEEEDDEDDDNINTGWEGRCYYRNVKFS